jgi:hypothetical protein
MRRNQHRDGKEAGGTFVFEKQSINESAELGHVAASEVEKRAPLVLRHVERRAEQLQGGLFLIGHGSTYDDYRYCSASTPIQGGRSTNTTANDIHRGGIREISWTEYYDSYSETECPANFAIL